VPRHGGIDGLGDVLCLSWCFSQILQGRLVSVDCRCRILAKVGRSRLRLTPIGAHIATENPGGQDSSETHRV